MLLYFTIIATFTNNEVAEFVSLGMDTNLEKIP